MGGDTWGQVRVTDSATSCQCEALRFPLLREYHFRRYASMRAAVSSLVQQGGGSLLEDACRGFVGREGGGGGGEEEEEAMMVDDNVRWWCVD